MTYKFKIVVDEMCEVGSTARKVTFNVVVTLDTWETLDRQVWTIDTLSSDGIGHTGSFDYNPRQTDSPKTDRGYPSEQRIKNHAQLYIENNLIERSFDDFLYH